MKRLEMSDILKPQAELKSRKISKEEFEPAYRKCIEAQKRIIEQKKKSQNPSYEDSSKIINPYYNN